MSDKQKTDGSEQGKPGLGKPGGHNLPQRIQKPWNNKFGPAKGGFKRDFTGFRRGSR